MHDLGYAYVHVGVLEWTPELIQQMKDEMDYGKQVLGKRNWVVADGKGKWVDKK